MLANRKPALPPPNPVLYQVDAVTALAAHAKASDLSIPGDLAGLQRIDPCLRDFLRPVGFVVARVQISYHAVAYTRVHAPARPGPGTRSEGLVAARVD